MSDFHVLMVLYKEGFGDIARAHLSMTDIKFIDDYLKYTLRYFKETEGTENSIVWRKTKEFENFLSDCIRTEEEQNRLEKKVSLMLYFNYSLAQEGRKGGSI